MKLIKCYVSSFGKLIDFEYDFNDNLNVINKQNGWGKSTFATFIKCMFYGLNDKKKSISDNERKKFAPWNSSDKFGGYVIFERNGNEFKIERFFGKRPNDDTVNLIDLKTGKIFPNQEDLGKRLFGVDEEGFLFSTYLSQNKFSITQNATLTAKYDNAYEIQDADLFVKALDKLQIKAKNISRRGEVGELFDVKRQIISIKEKLEFSKNARTELDNCKIRLKKLDDLIENLKKDVVDCNENLAKVKSVVEYNVKLESRTKLFNVLKELEEKKARLLDFFAENFEKALRVEEYIVVLEDYNKTLNSISLISQDILSLKEKRVEPTPQKKSTNKYLNILVPIFFLLSSVCFFIANTIPTTICGALLLVVAIIRGVKTFYLVNKNKNKTINPLNEHILSREKELSEYNEIKSKCENVLNEFVSLFNFNGLEYKDALNKIKNNISDFENVNAEILRIQNDIKNTAINKVLDEKTLGINADEVSAKLKSLNDILSIRERERGDLIASIKTLEDKIDGIVDLETQLGVLEEKHNLLKDELEAINYAIEFLTKADENIKAKYRFPLENSLNKYLQLLGGGYSATIDVDLNVNVLEKGAQKSTEYYSEGLKNLFELCKRFALIDVLFKNEKPFIMLDDPFSNFDKDRINSSLKLLNELKNEYQIIYFVCHDSRCTFNE